MRYASVCLLLACCASASIQAAPSGADLYAQHCMGCHGEQAQGGVGLPLALPSMLASVTDAYLAATIRHGRPGRIMPAFTELSDAEVEAIVRYLRGFGETPPQFDDSQPVHGDAQRGAQLYQRHCVVCHGPNGEGGPGTGVTFSRPRPLPVMPPALNNPGFLKAASDQVIKYTIMHGRAGTPMPSFLARGLREEEIDDLVSFVRAFERQPRATAPNEPRPRVLVAESPYGLQQTLDNLKQAVMQANFRVIRVQSLEHGFLPGDEQDGRRVILYFCNFDFLNQALAIDPRVGMFLPCRITLVEHEGRVRVMAVNPTQMSKLFNNAELKSACKEMLQVYENLLAEATL